MSIVPNFHIYRPGKHATRRFVQSTMPPGIRWDYFHEKNVDKVIVTDRALSDQEKHAVNLIEVV